MIKLSVFQKEILINSIIFVIGIILDVLGVFLGDTLSIPINDICIGIGCSLIASSVVAFLSLLYRQKNININNNVDNAIAALYQTNSEYNIINKIKESKLHIDICYLRGNTPYRLFKEINFSNLLSKGVKVRVILSDFKNNLNKDFISNHKNEECIYIIRDIKKLYPNSVELAISNNVVPLEWIRIDDNILVKINSYSELKNNSTTIMEISKSGSKEIFEQYELQFENIWRESKYIV